MELQGKHCARRHRQVPLPCYSRGCKILYRRGKHTLHRTRANGRIGLCFCSPTHAYFVSFSCFFPAKASSGISWVTANISDSCELCAWFIRLQIQFWEELELRQESWGNSAWKLFIVESKEWDSWILSFTSHNCSFARNCHKVMAPVGTLREYTGCLLTGKGYYHRTCCFFILNIFS